MLRISLRLCAQTTRLHVVEERNVVLRKRFATTVKPKQEPKPKSNSNNSNNSSSADEEPSGMWKSILDGDWKIPAAMGFTLIGFLQWYHLNHPSQDERRNHPSQAMQRLPGEHTAFEANMATERQMASINLFPYRAASRLWGRFHEKQVPEWLRAPLYKTYARIFDCKLDEMKDPLESYRNLGEFFSRQLKEGVRSFDQPEASTISSPVDGLVASIGVVEAANGIPTVEQVKGARYRLDEFLGDAPEFFTRKTTKDKRMYHCVIYLAPGDYHRIHSPIDFVVKERRHFPGNLYPVNQIAARKIPSLFVENERVALLGDWMHGFFSLTAVGATNVGSIVINQEPDLHTNVKEQDSQAGKCFKKTYPKPFASSRGDEIAQFKLGSTVVLVFEAPRDFEFTIKPGDKLALGEAIGVRTETSD